MTSGCDFYNLNPTSFCEHTIAQRNVFGDGTYTEWGNAISSLAMTLYGLIGMFHSHRGTDPISRLILAFLVYGGIGSALYHATGMEGFGTLDGLPMLALISFGMYSMFTEIVHNNTTEHSKSRWKNFVALISMGYFITAVVLEQYDHSGTVFRVCFGIPMGIFCFTMIYLYVRMEDLISTSVAKDQIRTAQNMLILGWSTGLGGLVFWLIDLLVCPHWNGVLFGHWVWHILIGYFGAILIAVMTFLRGDNYSVQPTLYFAWKIFPVCVYSRACMNNRTKAIF